jgi:hypothetical protein
MPGTVIPVTGMNSGYPGTYAQTPDSIITPRAVNSASAAIPFGNAVILNDDFSVTLFGATGTAARFAGVAVREVKTQGGTFTTPNLAGQYNPSECASILERGPVQVSCMNGTPVASSSVYLRTVYNATYPNAPVGGFEAASDSTNSVAIPNCKWGSGLDANKTATLVITTAVNA